MVAATSVEERRYDLAVIGGGMAGVCASIAAARLGLKVALINDRPVLGGNSSSEIRVPIGGADHDFRWARETGIIEELRIEDRFRNHAPIVSGQTNSIWDMILWEWTKREPNLDLYLNTSAREAIMESKTRIGKIACEQLGTERAFHISADLFIDASGDGRVGFSAGAEFRMGREGRDEFGESIAPEVADTKTLGTSLMFRAVDLGRPVKFTRPDWAEEYPTEQDLPFRGHARMESGHWWIELGGTQNTILDNEEIRDQLWRCLFGVWDHIKNKPGHDADNLALEWVGSVPGKRESRRFIGDYILTQHDVQSMARFPDAVAYGGWPIDLHPPKGIYHAGKPAEMKPVGLYSIPLRCLYSRNVENLLFAGRLISGTHVAHGSYRVQATGAVMGQAAGTAAAFCKRYECTPREAARQHIAEIQQQLLRDDCYLIDLPNADAEDLARRAKVTASSTDAAPGVSPEAVINGIARGTDAAPNQWRSHPGRPMPQWVELDLGEAKPVRLVQIAFDTALGRNWCTEPHPETVRDYAILADGAEVARVSGNNARFCRHSLDGVKARRIRIRVDATNGDPCARIFEVRIY